MALKSAQPTKRLPIAMQRRLNAAIRLVKAGQIDGDLALSYVVWPTVTVSELQKKAA